MNMRTRYRYIFLVTATILLLILRSEVLKPRSETGFRNNPRPASLTLSATDYDNEGPVPVLVVSYMRSGSSFTSAVITSYPSSFYIFEPLGSSMAKLSRNLSVELLDGTTISKSGELTVSHIAADFLHGWLTCKFDRLEKDAVIKITKYPSTSRFESCLKATKSYKNKVVSQNCLKILQKQCESSKIRLVKTIRVRLRTTVEILLKKIPGLKVIHLFRDQRPRFLSAVKLPNMMRNSLQTTAHRECSDAADDVNMYKVIKQEHPGQLGMLRYETLAEDPIGTAGRLFDFLHLPLTETSIEGILRMTSSTTAVRCDYCTTKRNSAKTAHAWRTQESSSFDKIKLIEKECENIQRILGYVPIKDMEQLRNLSVDLRIKTPFTEDTL